MSSETKQQNDDNNTIWDISLFVEAQIAQAFACGNCQNIPRQCINDADGKIFCEFCVAQLKMTNTRANTAIDKIIDGLKVKCTNINTELSHSNDDEKKTENNSDEDNDSHNSDEDNTDTNDPNKQQNCAWVGTLSEWKKHTQSECPFAVIKCKYCKKYSDLRYVIADKHENTCDELAIECDNGCGSKLFRKEMKLHLLNDCMEQLQTCDQCNRDDIKRKDLEYHSLNDCIERAIACKYAQFGCDIGVVRRSLMDKHYSDYGLYHLELKMADMSSKFSNEIAALNNKIIASNKMIEHLKYRNCKLQMQIHTKQSLKDDFLIVFESTSNSKNSFIASINFRYNSSEQNMSLVKALNHKTIKNKENNIIFKRVKDCSYAFAPNVFIDKIIGITSKSKTQHINSCVATLSNCICTFSIIYRIGGDTLNTNENNNICNILGTDVVFGLPQLLIPRFNHKIVYSQFHGILCVGGEPINKEDAKRELAEIDALNNKGQKSSKKETDKKQNRKAILNSVEQLNLAPIPQLSHYYNVRNANIRKDEQKLQQPPEPELKWRNLGQSMKYRRDCPSVGLFKSGQKYSEQLFVAGGWNEKDLSYVEMYNFKSRKWKQLASLNIKRNSAGMCEWKQKNNNMVIVGGWNKKTTHSVEEYDPHKNAWYALKNTNYAHKYYPSCAVYHDLNPFINSGYGVIVVVGNDGRLYGDEYVKKQQYLFKEKQKKSKGIISENEIEQSVHNPSSSVGSANDIMGSAPSIKDDWGFIEFYDPRDWMKKWTKIDNLPSFLQFTDDECKSLYFQSILACHHTTIHNTQ